MSIVKSLAVGNGDMFYIRHETDSFTMIDCSMSEDNRSRIVKELKAASNGKGITRFISTHPDDDHIGGLTYLHQQMDLVNFYCVKNATTKEDESEDFDQYCALRDDPTRAFYLYTGCSRKWLNETDEVRGGAGIRILWPNTDNQDYKDALAAASKGKKANNISAIVEYSLKGGTTVLWMGDLETKFMENLAVIPVSSADILFAPHHGRDTGEVPADWLQKIKPSLIIIGEAPAKYLNYYEGFDTITQNSAGDITFECESGKTHIYVSDRYYSVDFLDDEQKSNTYGFYIGTLKTG